MKKEEIEEIALEKARMVMLPNGDALLDVVTGECVSYLVQLVVSEIQKRHGYAKGSYERKCFTCGEHFVGDKRATACSDCSLPPAEQKCECNVPDDVYINPEDVVITAWSSRPQSSWSMHRVTGIQIVHIQTGIRVQCEAARSQHKNREACMAALKVMLAVASKPTEEN